MNTLSISVHTWSQTLFIWEHKRQWQHFFRSVCAKIRKTWNVIQFQACTSATILLHSIISNYIYNLNNLLHKCATQRLCNLMAKLTAAQRLYRVIPHETQFSRPISFLVSLRIVCCWCASTLGIYTRSQCGAKQAMCSKQGTVQLVMLFPLFGPCIYIHEYV